MTNQEYKMINITVALGHEGIYYAHRIVINGNDYVSSIERLTMCTGIWHTEYISYGGKFCCAMFVVMISILVLSCDILNHILQRRSIS